MTDVVAFDIDGTLTDDTVLGIYRNLSLNTSVKTGIVTRRPEPLMDEFINENFISTDFAYSRVVKSIAFEDIEKRFDSNSFTYVGNRITDCIYAKVSGWEFILAQTLNKNELIG